MQNDKHIATLDLTLDRKPGYVHRLLNWVVYHTLMTRLRAYLENYIY